MSPQPAGLLSHPLIIARGPFLKEERILLGAIAERLGISRQAVEVRLCRGRAALKDQVSDILGGDL